MKIGDRTEYYSKVEQIVLKGGTCYAAIKKGYDIEINYNAPSPVLDSLETYIEFVLYKVESDAVTKEEKRLKLEERYIFSKDLTMAMEYWKGRTSEFLDVEFEASTNTTRNFGKFKNTDKSFRNKVEKQRNKNKLAAKSRKRNR
jgi:hypothetical protein